MKETCVYCYEEMESGRDTITRWYDERQDKDLAAHNKCYLAVKWVCPQCKSGTGIKIPRGLPIYCEDCGWPDDDDRT